MEVYRLGVNPKSKTDGYVLVTIKLLEQTDMSNFTEAPLAYRGRLMNDFYLPYRINMGQVVSITSLDEQDQFEQATVVTDLHGDITLVPGKFFQIKNHRYLKDDAADDYALEVYKYKSSVLNVSPYVSGNYTGVKFVFFVNGKVSNKLYFKHGQLVIREVYFDNPFNTRKRVIKYTDQGNICNEYVYDSRENLITENIYDSTGKIVNRINYLEYQNRAEPYPVSTGKRKRTALK